MSPAKTLTYSVTYLLQDLTYLPRFRPIAIAPIRPGAPAPAVPAEFAASTPPLTAYSDLPEESGEQLVRTVCLPGWLAPREWMRSFDLFYYAWALGADWTWPEHWLRTIAYDPEPRHEVVHHLVWVELLKARTHSSRLRASLHRQLRYWLDRSLALRSSTPFTPEQWRYLLSRRVQQEAALISKSLVHAAEHLPLTGIPWPAAPSDVKLPAVPVRLPVPSRPGVVVDAWPPRIPT